MRGACVPQNLAMERTGHASTRQELLQTQERLARTAQEADARQGVAEQVRQHWVSGLSKIKPRARRAVVG